MTKYYEVLVTMTGKTIGDKSPKGEGYAIFHQETKRFITIRQAREWIQAEYNNKKKEKMYVDGKNEQVQQIGWIYCFKNSDMSHNSKPWYQQDWIEIKEIKATTIL